MRPIPFPGMPRHAARDGMRSRPRTRGNREAGFVLIAALWFVALLALVAVIVGSWVEHSLGRTSGLQDRITARRETIDLVNEISFLMLTNYFSPRGLEILAPADRAAISSVDAFAFVPGEGTRAVALDNRAYRLGDAVVELQDDHGLYKLNFPDPEALGRLLGQYGVSYDASAILNDRLLDYMVQSPLQRLNGANAEAYLRAGRPPPRNDRLLTPWEAYRVLGWDASNAVWNSPVPLPEVTTVRDIGGLNPNTAPAAVLRTIPGVDDRAIASLVNYRANRVIQNELDLDSATGLAIPVHPGQFYFFPGNSLRVTLLSERDPLARVVEIRLDPLGSVPIRIDYSIERPQTAAERAVLLQADLPVLPLPTDF